LSLLNLAYPASFEALVADRKGDVFVLQGDKAKATAEYQKAYRLFDRAQNTAVWLKSNSTLWVSMFNSKR